MRGQASKTLTPALSQREREGSWPRLQKRDDLYRGHFSGSQARLWAIKSCEYFSM